jgi:hypothetical protein
VSRPPAAADPALVAELEAMIAEGRTPEFDPAELAQTGKRGWTIERISVALEMLAAERKLTPSEKILCPSQACRLPISREDVAAQRCPHCGIDFRTLEEPEPGIRRTYRYAGPPSRDLEWAVVIHGMNTRGPWQEEFSWRLALKLRYSAPVLIYKFGLVRFGVLFRRRHRAMVQSLGERLRKSFALAAASGRPHPPDVILHSFATLLFAKLLDDADFKDLKFGRVVLAGCIVRPDHRWSRHVEAGRIEAILNHCGSKDRIVDFAAFAIPDTGPSGRVGLADPAVLNVLAEDYDHSTFFQDCGLDENLASGGLWDRFLRVPMKSLQGARMDNAEARAWHPLPPPLRRIALPIAALLAGGTAAIPVWGVSWLAHQIATKP